MTSEPQKRFLKMEWCQKRHPIISATICNNLFYFSTCSPIPTQIPTNSKVPFGCFGTLSSYPLKSHCRLSLASFFWLWVLEYLARFNGSRVGVMENQQKHKRRINWLFVAFGLTLAYVVLLGGFLLPATLQCEGAVWLWQKYLSCRPANELGDFLSGAFAPVAFLWLVAAVLIQAQELKAQREELTLTRQELADSRDVMKEQAEQARNQAIQAQRQADFIGEQTENLKRQAEDYYRERQDRIFDEALRALHKSVVLQLSNASFQVPTTEGTVIGRFGDYRNMEPEQAMHEMRGSLQNLDRSIAKLRPREKLSLPSGPISTLSDALEKLIEMRTGLSPSHQIKFDSLGLVTSRECAKSVIDKEQVHAAAR
ncbi:hypothetical protein CN172_30920 [Sinorhizobium meliloti]|uniref:hypothetical protein n=1 Tax=Rhizobium meliloti TaxID=382 RepID=UPI000FDBDCCA|nr:hypothetical protein [Sinorhizobium meliloti]RVH36392.1 hypothetical protein CN208_32400 [Sinorhizobium meliloti]RVK05319.1 hypothetical protein CN172_30920 [Sinorhizobium meliloti]